MIVIIISAIIIAYVLIILLFWLGWEKSQPCVPNNINLQPVSIIIAVRNEEENIIKLLTDISRQSYPEQLLEIIIVDDHSTDSTAGKIQSFAGEASCPLTLSKLADGEGKKAAISKAISLTANEIILTIDGDCRVDADWVASMMACFDNTETQLVSGPVRMYPQATFWQRIQSIEFSSLISVGAATLNLGWPTMANAANLAYRKSAVTKVKAHYNQNISSGDDVFLLHEISHSYSKGIVFCRDPRAIVDTKPSNDLSSFYNQRKRWAGKWQFYNDNPTVILAAFVFLVNLTIISLPLLVLLNYLTLVVVANLLVLKFVFEFIYLREVQKFFNSRFLLHEFTILAIIYPAYVTLMALVGLVGKYKWKDRMTR
jgi:biofilm PGA synthesis N-glycosyltransferase PgaC